MKLFVVRIFSSGFLTGYLGYMDSLDVYSSCADAKLFSDRDVAEEMAEDFIKYMGSDYLYDIVSATLTIG